MIINKVHVNSKIVLFEDNTKILAILIQFKKVFRYNIPLAKENKIKSKY